MNIEMRHIRPDELLCTLSQFTDMTLADVKVACDCGKDAETIVAYFWGEKLLGVMMLRPITIISDTVFAWLITTPEVNQHKIAVGRIARLCLKEVQAHGKQIVSYCTNNPSSLRWIGSLGAKFGEPTERLVPYIIEVIPNG